MLISASKLAYLHMRSPGRTKSRLLRALGTLASATCIRNPSFRSTCSYSLARPMHVHLCKQACISAHAQSGTFRVKRQTCKVCLNLRNKQSPYAFDRKNNPGLFAVRVLAFTKIRIRASADHVLPIQAGLLTSINAAFLFPVITSDK